MVCAFTGHRPNKLYGYQYENQIYYQQIKEQLKIMISQMIENGYDTFITGAAQGFDQIAFTAVAELKVDKYPNIQNILYLPCLNQDKKWSEIGLFSKAVYKDILNSADKIITISKEYTFSCMHERDEAMVNDADAMICLFNDKDWKNADRSGTAYTMRLADKKGIPMIHIQGTNCNIYNIYNRNHTVPKEICISYQQEGDLFGITDGIFCQQVNCQGVMGAGLAKAIKEQYPIVYEEYMKHYNQHKGHQFGTHQLIPTIVNKDGVKLWVANIYSQDRYGNPQITHQKYTDTDILLKNITSICETHPDRNIYIPKGIGCGYGGEQWEILEPQIHNLEFDNLYIIDTISKEIIKTEQNKYQEEIEEIDYEDYFY